MENLEMSFEDFSDKYIKPRVKALADKMKRNEPLTDLERRVVEYAFGLDDDPSRIFIAIPPKTG